MRRRSNRRYASAAGSLGPTQARPASIPESGAAWMPSPVIGLTNAAASPTSSTPLAGATFGFEM